MSKRFEVKTTEKTIINGFLIKTDDKHEMMFDKNVFGQRIHVLNKTDIKNPTTLIASYLANSKLAKESEQKFLTVEMFDEDASIITVDYTIKAVKEDNSRTTYFIHENNWIEAGQMIKLKTDISNIEIKIDDLGLEKIIVPNNFKYTKNDFINSMLRTIKAPYNIDRKVVKAISDSIEVIREAVYKKESVYMNKRTLKIAKTIPQAKDRYYIFNI